MDLESEVIKNCSDTKTDAMLTLLIKEASCSFKIMKRCIYNDLQFLNQEVAINIFNNNDKII